MAKNGTPAPARKEWSDLVVEKTAPQLLEVARLLFGCAKAEVLLPDPEQAAKIICCLALSGEGFLALYPQRFLDGLVGTKFRDSAGSTLFLNNVRDALDRARAVNSNGSDALPQTKPNAQQAFVSLIAGSPGAFLDKLQACIEALAETTRDLSTLSLPLGLSPLVAKSRIEDHFLTHIAKQFEEEFGAIRTDFSGQIKPQADTAKHG